MPVEKGLVLTAIEAKFKGKSISKTFKDNLATKWAAKIDNDTDIDAYVDDREDVVLEAVREADQRVTDAVKKLAPPKKEGNEPPKEEEIDTEGMTPFEKMMLAKFGQLETKITGFETQQKTQSLSERFRKDERLKGVPEFILNKSIPASDDEYETSVETLATEYKSFAETNKIVAPVSGSEIPGGGNTPPAGQTKQASKEDVDKLAQSIGI